MVSAGDNTFPQWGVYGDGSSATIIEATSNAEKQSDINSYGALVWFTSKSNAQNFVNSQSGLLSGNVPGLSDVGAITTFLSDLTSAHFWIRLGEFGVGALLFIAGTRELLRGSTVGNAAKSATKTVKKTAEVAAALAPK